MKITYWSDFPCPFCYTGSARMKRAIRELHKKNEIELEMKSFRLAPKDAKEPPKEDIVTMIAQAISAFFYNVTVELCMAMYFRFIRYRWRLR